MYRLDNSKESSATTPKYLPNRANDPDDEDLANRNKEFESRRKAHYNEFKMAQLLRSRIEQEDDDNEDGDGNKNGQRAGFGDDDDDDDDDDDHDEELREEDDANDNRKF